MDADTALTLFREFVSLPIIQAILVVAALVVVFAGTILTKISSNTKKQTELTSKMVGHLSSFATDRAKADSDHIDDLEKRIEVLEELRTADRKVLAEANLKIGKLEEQLRLVTAERDRLIAHQEKLITVSNEALSRLSDIKKELSMGDQQRQELLKVIDKKDEQIREKDKQIREKDERISELLTQIEAITQQMTILRKNQKKLETELAEAKKQPKVEPGVMVVKKEEKKEGKVA